MIPGARTFVLGIPRLAAKREATMAHLTERGIEAERFDAIDCEINGLGTCHTYEYDNPGTNWNIGPKLVTHALAFRMLWSVCQHLDNDAFFFFEDDVRFDEDWKVHFDDAMQHIDPGWQVLYVGSCCTTNRNRRQIHNRLWEVQYALCTHAFAFRKSAIPIFLESCEKIYAPLDISMIIDVKVPLKRYAILPRIAHQLDTVIPV